MSVLKPFVVAAAVVVGLTSFASAATRHHHQTVAQPNVYTTQPNGYFYNGDDANTAAAARFQDQFKNTY